MADDDPFLIHETSTQGKPATHAIVIGVGDYPHLPGGSSKQTEDHEGMRQLTSPPISAREFAAWLTSSFEHPDKPLASVALLLSERKRKPFVNQRTGKSKDVALANSGNVLAALREWVDRGNASPDNLLLFFYCGHGLESGSVMSLPLADYGADEWNSLKGALDLRSFIGGMNRCRASEQCYFVDACRTPSEMLANSEGQAGQTPVLPGARNPQWPLLRNPVFYSTMKGYRAYSEPKKASIYTSALLDCLQHFGANDSDGPWRVDTYHLMDAVEHLMSRLPFDRLAPPTAGNTVKIQLNCLKETPHALVYVKTDPPTALRKIAIECSSGGVSVKPTEVRDPSKTERVLRLPAGHYKFLAKFPGRRETSPAEGYISPVRRPINFKEPPA